MIDSATSEPTYHVVVTREDGSWLADVPELAGAHTDARNLPTPDRYVREVIVLAAGLRGAGQARGRRLSHARQLALRSRRGRS